MAKKVFKMYFCYYKKHKRNFLLRDRTAESLTEVHQKSFPTEKKGPSHVIQSNP